MGTTRIALGLICALAVLAAAAPLPAQEKEPKSETTKSEPTAAGLWQQNDSSGRPLGWFQINERNGVFQGQIVKTFPKEGEVANPLCTGCEGEKRNAPWVGLTFITGMKRDGLTYEDGRILDPRDGKVYRATMKLSPDGQTLTVRGFVGVALFGMDQSWQRLPESAVTGSTRTQGRGQK